MPLTYNDIIERIKDKKYVSFDMFETIVVRNVTCPEHIFEIVEKEYAKKDSRYLNFSQRRQHAEQAAIRKSNKAEINLSDIYKELGEESKDFINAELSTEMNSIIANAFFTPVFEYCKATNKIVIIASDMYLDKAFIADMLKKVGINYDYLFVSSDIQKRKSTGSLFKHILKELDISRSDLVHIGNNRKSDFLIPRLLGIDAIHYKYNIFQFSNVTESLAEAKLYHSYIEEGEKSWYKEGYYNFGPLLYGFCTWLHKQFIDNNIDQICFLARDGKIVMDAYASIYGQGGTYIYASRRSLTVPMLTDVNGFKEICEVVPYIKRVERVKDLLHKVGVEDEELVKKAEELLGEYVSRSDLLGEKGCDLFKVIEHAMKTNARIESTNAVAYLKENLTGNNIALVDIGWYGTMQNAIEKFVHSEIDNTISFFGYYIGYIKSDKHYYPNMKAEGYVYDYQKDKKDTDVIFGFNGLIESFFTTNHGSTKRYQNRGGDIEVELEAEENIQKWLIDYQNGARQSVHDLNTTIKAKSISMNCAYCRLERLLTQPTIDDIDYYGGIEFYDVYYEKLINAKNLKKYIFSPKQFILDYGKSNWKIGFLKKVLNVPGINYQFLYKLINRIKS